MKKNFKKMLASTLVLTFAMGLVGCSSQSSTTQESTEGTQETMQLRVGMECGYAPFNWTQLDDANNAVPISGGNSYANGYDVQIAKKIAEDMGRELVIVKTEWDGLVPAVQSGVLDLIIAGMSPTAERKESIDFSDSYYTADLVVVTLKDNAYVNATSLEDLSGAKITAQLNTFHDSVIDQIPSVNHVTPMDSFPAMRVALQSGIIDGYVTERPEAISASSAINEFTFIEFEPGQGFEASEDDVSIAVGMKQGSQLAQMVNDALAKISEEDRLQLMEDAINHQPINE